MPTILSLNNENPLKEGRDSFAGLTEKHRAIAENLVSDWHAKISLMGETENSTADSYLVTVKRLLSFTGKAPWMLRKKDVVDFLAFRQNERDGVPLAELTVAAYGSAWRSFQAYMLMQDVANEISVAAGQRPQEFIDDQNCIPVRRAKSDQTPKGWALTPEFIDKIEDELLHMISIAKKRRSKAYYALIRDRVMFHLAIHFALRVSELVTLTLKQFSPHTSPKMREKFGKYGALTVSGKNKVTGTIPMRDEAIYRLLILYVEKVRPKLLLRRSRKEENNGLTSYKGKTYAVADLLFFSERGNVLNPRSFRKRLEELSMAVMTPQKMTPHTLRHTGCTLMAPLYSPDVAQKYMRHKNLATTLHYYHPDPLNAGAHLNPDYDVAGWFEDEEDEDDY
ncbi:tyrosine-type recombinase/integrase [Spongiibacter tropicus]|uniref:tyrosine-type recombinase/integrase n=1 Tax=Spongiibacter tropicus TaxID=454602 RepID=UPI002356D64B|nr:tyrosine-type recombinase/integrase [Spongiibacter tropicus]|tara:strand:+ start:10308 stop:11489 length:1182 start_codon:yes stop_codon:yes gene_type:complete